MVVAALIEKLRTLDPDANVVIEHSDRDACYELTDVELDDSGDYVMLVPGKLLPILVDE